MHSTNHRVSRPVCKAVPSFVRCPLPCRTRGCHIIEDENHELLISFNKPSKIPTEASKCFAYGETLSGLREGCLKDVPADRGAAGVRGPRGGRAPGGARHTPKPPPGAPTRVPPAPCTPQPAGPASPAVRARPSPPPAPPIRPNHMMSALHHLFSPHQATPL